jgi:hypothetical protein
MGRAPPASWVPGEPRQEVRRLFLVDHDGPRQSSSCPGGFQCRPSTWKPIPNVPGMQYHLLGGRAQAPVLELVSPSLGSES